MIGVLSDAHGNAEGLRRAIALLRRHGAERLFFLGDSVGYLSDVGGVIATLRAEAVTSLLGNHDAMLLGRLPLDPARDRSYRIAAARAALSPSDRAWLEALQPRLELRIGGRNALLVHGSPVDPLGGYVYPDTDVRTFGPLEFDVVFMGHTHRPFVRAEGATTWANVGSCGLPRDHGALASAALYDPDAHAVTIVRTRLDVDALVAAEGPTLPSDVLAVLRRVSPSPIGRLFDDD